MNTLRKPAAFFDVDHTIVKEHTQKILARYFFTKSKKGLMFMLRLAWLLWTYKIGLLSDVRPLMRRAYHSMKGVDVRELKQGLSELYDEKVAPQVFSQALQTIQAHKEAGREVVLISTSIAPIVNLIKEKLGLSFAIATELETDNGVYTGRIKGPIIYGQGKVRALEEWAPKKGWDLSQSFAYSDHHSDIPLLEAVAHPIVVNPTRILKNKAKANNWPIKHWRL